MPPTSVELPRFQGLDLRDDPQEVSLGRAIDTLNTHPWTPGRLTTRGGYTSFYTEATKVYRLAQYARPSSTPQMFIGASGSYRWVSQAGASLATVAMAATPVLGVTQFNDGSSIDMYVATDQNAINKWTGAVNSAVVGAPVARWLDVQQPDNRLVAAANSNSLTNRLASRVSFSDAGIPGTWGANNWVELNPGDGNRITGLASWDTFLVAGKPTALYVFYGNGTDGSGNPVFNYRRSGSVGPVDSNGVTMVSTKYGVCFLAADGVYVYDGQARKISVPLDPLFAGVAMPYTSSLATFSGDLSNSAIGFVDDRLYVTPDSTLSQTLVYDFVTSHWTVYDWQMSALCGFKFVSRLDVAAAVSSTSVVRHLATATTDAGAAISTKYRTGFWNPGTEGTEAWIRELLLDGSGTVTVKTAVNDNATLRTGQAVTLGTAPAVAQGRDRRGVRGRNVSYEFSGAAPWSLSRVTPIMWGQSPVGMKAA